MASWPYSSLLGRPLDPSEMKGPEPYMSFEVGGPLDGLVTLVAEVATKQVSVLSSWGTGTIRHEQKVTGLELATAEALAGRWADKLSAGHEPVAA